MRPSSSTRIIHFLILLGSCLTGTISADDWGAMATISTTMGVQEGRLCLGESSRGDIGCPTYAPSVSPTGTLTTTAVSLTTSGTNWGYLTNSASYIPNLSGNTASFTNTVLTGSRLWGASTFGSDHFWIGLRGTAADGQRIGIGIKPANTDGLVDSLIFTTNGSTRMVISPTGYIGMGTNIPLAPLHVQTATSQVPLNLQNSTQRWMVGPDSNAAFVIYNAGNTGAYLPNGGTAWVANSDARPKKDIQPLSEHKGLEALAQLTPVTFHWRTVGAPDSTQTGFLAQNVEKVFPELVSPAPNTTIRTDTGATVSLTDVKGVNYEGLITPMILAIQQLKAENEQLRQRLERLEANAK